MLRSRPFDGEGDFPALRAFLVSLRSQVGPACWHVGDLTWRTFLHGIHHDLSRTVRLWEDEKGILGFGILTPPRRGKDPSRRVAHFDLQVAPRTRGRGVEEAIVAWAESASREMEEPGEAVAARVLVAEFVYEDEASPIRSLEELGFRRGDWEGTLLSRPLDAPTETPSLPDGFALRAMGGEGEISERAAAHREAFHPSRVTDEHYLRLFRMSEYRRALDLVAVSPEAAIASFAIIWKDEVNREVEFEPVGTRPAFQRRGLGSAVLYEGLRRAKALGARSAVVGPVDLRDEPALRLYESVGFVRRASGVELVRHRPPSGHPGLGLYTRPPSDDRARESSDEKSNSDR
jgi:ribosomal protein S18 acetylase RimI-like enzyme